MTGKFFFFRFSKRAFIYYFQCHGGLNVMFKLTVNFESFFITVLLLLQHNYEDSLQNSGDKMPGVLLQIQLHICTRT